MMTSRRPPTAWAWLSWLLTLAVLCLCGLAPGAWAQTRCCVRDDKYEMRGGATDIVGSMILSLYMPRISEDKSARKLAVQEVVFEGQQSENVTTIVDYNKRLTYVIMYKTKTCQVTSLPFDFSGRCIPPDAEYTGEIPLGYGQNRLLADSWTVSRENKTADAGIWLYMIVSRGDCVPVSETIITSSKGAVVREYILYYDYKPGITDPTVFDIPAFCQTDGASVPHHTSHVPPTARAVINTLRR